MRTLVRRFALFAAAIGVLATLLPTTALATQTNISGLVLDPLRATEDRGHEALRLYEGARVADDRSAPFSFVPCRPYAPGGGAFARPAIELDRRWLTPRLAMGAKATEATADEERAVWTAVVDQVTAAGLCLGVELDAPASAPRTPDAREEIG